MGRPRLARAKNARYALRESKGAASHFFSAVTCPPRKRSKKRMGNLLNPLNCFVCQVDKESFRHRVVNATRVSVELFGRDSWLKEIDSDTYGFIL